MNFIRNRMEYRRLCLRPCGFIQKARKEERRTAETIRIEIPIEVDDNTGPGTSSVEKNMNKVKDAADKVKSSKGGTHYVSSYSGSRGYSARAGKAKITIKNGSGKTHPWHLIHTDSGSNVYGWVDDGTFE